MIEAKKTHYNTVKLIDKRGTLLQELTIREAEKLAIEIIRASGPMHR